MDLGDLDIAFGRCGPSDSDSTPCATFASCATPWAAQSSAIFSSMLTTARSTECKTLSVYAKEARAMAASSPEDDFGRRRAAAPAFLISNIVSVNKL
jgi:hypothetical protein